MISKGKRFRGTSQTIISLAYKISRGFLAKSLEIQEIQLSKAVAILFGATV
jgi:hypothetical protein